MTFNKSDCSPSCDDDVRRTTYGDIRGLATINPTARLRSGDMAAMCLSLHGDCIVCSPPSVDSWAADLFGLDVASD